eukprot:CAMPEP_0117558428 /NCGR_PEP_ID=MMETSP0784-20121206/52831_1 /TAXON_ID=39447 /ORGANISM="" /LENGTH=94 /DNA_ID=CAMNT_0005355757 /DNA_START=1 /DNA_END=281 /DNA_ORIENTATION=+
MLQEMPRPMQPAMPQPMQLPMQTMQQAAVQAAPPHLPAAAGIGLASASMQDHLNDYYAQWWAQCGGMSQDAQGNNAPAGGNSQAFDKAALERLA